jgi:cellulose synthase operon protein C
VALAAAAAVLVAVGAAGWLQRRSAREPSWTPGSTRPLEARLSDARADVYRPFELPRGTGATPVPDYRLLEHLQRREDRRGLASLLLLVGLRGQAGALLATVEKDPAFDNERGVQLLLEEQPERALRSFDGYLAAHPRSGPGRFNRGLALRAMSLPYAAAQAFAEVSALGEPGWSSEARAWSERLRAETDRRQSQHRELGAQLLDLAREGRVPPAELARRHPDRVRLHFYQALAERAGPEGWAGLSELAELLDGHHGGRTLRDHVARLGRLPPQRSREIAEREWALIGSPVGAGEPGPGSRALIDLAEQSPDPWIQAVALRKAAHLDLDTAPDGGRERLLARAHDVARTHRLLLLRIQIQNDRSHLLLRQQRPLLAGPLARQTRALAAEGGFWDAELESLAQLVLLSSHEQNPSAVKAYADELSLRGAPCALKAAAQGRVAERATNDGRLDDARAALVALDTCGPAAPPTTAILQALSELTRADPEGPFAARFQHALERFRGGAGGQALSATDRLLASVFEGRAWIDRDPPRSRRLLEQVIADADALSGTGRLAALPRLLAYRRLISEAMKSGELPRALALMLGEARLAAPAGCTVGISEDLNRASIVVRTGDGQYHGRHGHRVEGREPEAVVPGDLVEALAGCDEVSVVALSPFRGKPRLLPANLAWQHHVGREADRAPFRPGHHLVVSDAVSPAGFGLDTLSLWRPAPDTSVSRHLRGQEATPRAVLDALASADLVELHVHGLAEFRMTEAPFLVLSGRTMEDAVLKAEDIRKLSLPRHPFVILAACNSAVSSPFWPSQSGRWSLTTAFLDAGARGVLAAHREIPDQQSSAFIDRLVRDIQAGLSPARALRDGRLRWTREDEPWVNDVVLFH